MTSHPKTEAAPPADAVPEGARPAREAPSGPRAYLGPLVAAGVTVIALGAVLLHSYVTRGWRYPLGWDSMFYTWRVKAVPVDGLARIGTIRAGLPLLLAVLGRATGRDAFTLVAIIPSVLTGVAALGAAAMARAAFGISARWVPVVGFLAWAAFGSNGIPLHHFDNLLNASLILAGFGAALAFVSGGRGALAAGLLFMGAGLAHWPFYVFAMGVFVLAVVTFARRDLLDRLSGRRASMGPSGPLLGAAAGSGLFVGLTLLSPPPTGWYGGRPWTLRTLLRERTLARLGGSAQFIAFGPAAAGAAVLALDRRSRARSAGAGPERRRPRSDAAGLFLWLMAAWTALTVAASVAQLAGLPTAGARVLSFFFPAPLLTGLLVWWLATRAASRGVAGRAVGAAVVAAALLGFGLLMWGSWSNRHPWVEQDAVRQVAAAGSYLDTDAAGRQAVFVIDMRTRVDLTTLGRWWLVIKATVPAADVARIHRYVGTPQAYLARVPATPLGAGIPPGETDRPDPGLWAAPGRPDPVVMVIQRYDAAAYADLAAASPQRVVAPGVFVLQGPLPSGPVPAVPTPVAQTHGRDLVMIVAALVALLFAAGGGWALALLPEDPVLRVALAPALGIAAVTLVALGWDRVGLGFSGVAAMAPLAIAAAAGWVAAWRTLSSDRSR